MAVLPFSPSEEFIDGHLFLRGNRHGHSLPQRRARENGRQPPLGSRIDPAGRIRQTLASVQSTRPRALTGVTSKTSPPETNATVSKRFETTQAWFGTMRICSPTTG